MGCRPDPQPTTMTADELARLGADISPHSVLLRHHPRGEPTVEGPRLGTDAERRLAAHNIDGNRGRSPARGGGVPGGALGSQREHR
jgi:hypothetical protein